MGLNQMNFTASKKVVMLMQAIIILTAVALPIFHSQYIAPSFQNSLLDSAKDEAERVAEYIKHAIFQEHGESQISLQQQFDVDVFQMSETNSLYLKEVIQDLKLWKIKLFRADGTVVFSTVDGEVGTANSKPYFQGVIAKGITYTATTYKTVVKDSEPHFFAEVYVPIVEDNVFVGAFELYYDLDQRKQEMDFLTSEIFVMLMWLTFVSIVLAIVMGIVLDKLRAARTGYEKGLFELATNDKLTQVLNRGSIEAAIGSCIENHKEYNMDYSLVMFDVDHFKKVNDVHGHQAGDDVLVALAKITKNRLRESDMVGRYGGEEFMALLPNTNASGATALAENLRTIIEGTPIKTADAGDVNITVSLGVVTFSDVEDLNTHNLIKKADAAMYYSKHSGRNQVTYAEVA